MGVRSWRLGALTACLVGLALVVNPGAALGQCSAGTQVAPTCDGLGYEGCCLPDGTLEWCEGGVLCAIYCAQNPDPAYQKCGWNPDLGFYDCGASTLPEPTCTYPYDCPGYCKPCGGISYEGCCDGLILKWCECGCLRTIDCSLNSAPDNTCGWSASAGFYDCGQVGEDPSGAHPIACSGGPCIPSCGGKQCGDDGCGGSCGTCPAGYVCNPSGICEVGSCTPSCAGKQCGDDGCGGSCGTCPAGQTCEAGTCVGAGCGADPGMTCLGSCGSAGSGGCWCDETCEDFGDCCPDFEACCPDLCTPDCFLKECGDDGCGGSCGTCPAGKTCDAFGQCVGCTPSCAGMQCGDDGCGGSCGTCPTGYTCSASGQCVLTCTPSCAGKQCGDDGCGGTCGSCPHGFICQAGTCVEVQVCTPQCEGKECGPDGCDGSCGVCPPPLQCNEAGQCDDPTTCTPSCAGKQCGSDGCGGSCGTCPPGQTCNASGRCVGASLPDAATGGEDAGVSPETAGGLDAAGCPPGTVWYYGTCKPTAFGGDASGGGASEGGPSGGGCAASPHGVPAWWPVLIFLSLPAIRWWTRRAGS